MAFIFFAFAQAAVVRSSGQSAADAAALAAAREARDHLFDEFADALDDEENLERILAGDRFEVATACEEAARLASLNDAVIADCDRMGDQPGYTVVVRTEETVGESLIPGTEDETALVRASAVIRPVCAISSAEDDGVRLDCEEGRRWTLEPDALEDELEPRDLFHVYLDD